MGIDGLYLNRNTANHWENSLENKAICPLPQPCHTWIDSSSACAKSNCLNDMQCSMDEPYVEDESSLFIEACRRPGTLVGWFRWYKYFKYQFKVLSQEAAFAYRIPTFSGFHQRDNQMTKGKVKTIDWLARGPIFLSLTFGAEQNLLKWERSDIQALYICYLFQFENKVRASFDMTVFSMVPQLPDHFATPVTREIIWEIKRLGWGAWYGHRNFI